MINLYPTHIEIDNYTEGTKKTLENSLSVWDAVTHSYSFSAFLLDEEAQKIYIPGGYPVDKLQKWFPTIKVVDHRDKFNKHKIVDKYALMMRPKNDAQVKAIDFLMGNNSKGLSFPQKYLALQTGQGKTYCVINYLFRTRKLPLIIVDQENLAIQWKDSIMKFTSLLEKEIFMIQGRKSIEKLLSMNEKELSQYKYFIGIHRTFGAMFDEDPESITKLFDHLGIGCKVFDEAHIEYYNIFYMDCVTNCETIYLSATPERSNPNEKKVYENIFYSVPIHMGEINDRYLEVIRYEIDTHCPAKELVKFKKVRGFDVLSFSKYLASDEEAIPNVIYDLFPKIFKQTYTTNKKIAIVVKMIDHIKIVKDIVNQFFEDKENTFMVSELHGDIKGKKREEALASNIIITTDSSFTKGLDVENLSVIINFVPVGTIPKLNQLTGRLRRLKDEKTFFVDVCDMSVPEVVKQCKIRMTYYKKSAKKIYIMKGYGYNGK